MDEYIHEELESRPAQVKSAFGTSYTLAMFVRHNSYLFFAIRRCCTCVRPVLSISGALVEVAKKLRIKDGEADSLGVSQLFLCLCILAALFVCDAGILHHHPAILCIQNQGDQTKLWSI